MPGQWEKLHSGQVAATFRGQRFVGTSPSEVLTRIRNMIREEERCKQARRKARLEVVR